MKACGPWSFPLLKSLAMTMACVAVLPNPPEARQAKRWARHAGREEGEACRKMSPKRP